MLLKRILTTLAFLVAWPLGLWAQTNAPGGLAVTTSPPGAEVTLDGEAVVVGISPTSFHHNLVGDYRVTIKRYGFETYKTRVTLDPTKQMALDVKLTSKTRLKSAARSLFIPGWGQRYTDQGTKGFFFTVLAAGSVAAFLLADEEFNYRNDLFKQQRHLFDSSVAAGTSYNQIAAIQRQVASTQQKAYDAETTRRVTIGIVAGVWALNVMDALLFFPSDQGSFSVGGLSFQPSAKPGTLGLAVSRRF